MKKLLLLSMLVLTACSWSSNQPQQTATSAPAPAAQSVTSPTGQPLTPQPVQNSQTSSPAAYASGPVYTIQDDYFGPTYGTVTEVQYVQQPGVAYETQRVTEQYQVQTQGAYNQLPAPMYMPQNIQGVPPQTGGQVQVMQNPSYNPYYPYAPNTQNTAVQNNMGSGSIIVLQHPQTRELVRCDFTDYNCVGSYQSQGYVQLRAAPHFAGFNDVPSATDYPPRRYRDNNNIPRW